MSTFLQFLGAARTVTGSKHVLTHRGKTVMMDCGMFQGLKEWRLKNWDPFPLPAGYVDHVVLSHAHLDHTGYLPRFTRNGFAGRIYCTAPTLDLCKIMLPDSAHIQEEDARYANKEGFSKHLPALPLYTMADVENTLPLLEPVSSGKPVSLNKNISFELKEAGHILGSSTIRFVLRREDQSAFSLVFSGDLGRYGEHLLPDPAPVEDADFLILESTYGNRLHGVEDVASQLAEIITDTYRRRGMVIIPSFAVGRTQELLYHIRDLQEESRIPVMPVYVDSPLAVQATRIFCAHPESHSPEVRAEEEAEGECAVLCHHLHLSTTRQQSMAINNLEHPAIVISASGMCEAGRILHHLKLRLPDPRNAVIFVGYQAEGTRGRRLLDGEEAIKIHGELVPVRAGIHNIDGFSAHADYREIMRWLGHFRRAPKMCFIVHGETSQMEALGERIRTDLGWPVHLPGYLEKYDLSASLPPLQFA